MKKLLIMMLCLPMIGFGQTKDQEFYKNALEYEDSDDFELSIKYFSHRSYD